MNKIKTGIQGEMPFYQDSLEFFQTAVRTMGAGLGSIFGDNYILSGCKLVSGNVSAGWLVLGGEVCWFEGAPFSGSEMWWGVSVDTTFPVTFRASNEVHDIHEIRFVRLSATEQSGMIQVSIRADDELAKLRDFNPAMYYTIMQIEAMLRDYYTQTQVNALVVPVGGIIMWTQGITNIPTGWALCDGRTVNGMTTPDLSGRFVVGYHDEADNYGILGKTGGESHHQLTVDELPEHDHSYEKPYNVINAGDGTLTAYVSCVTEKTLKTGGNQAFDNRPPYYVVAYIMRVL